MGDIVHGHLLAHGLFKGDTWRIDTYNMSKTCMTQLFLITYTSCYQADRHIARLL